MSLDLQPQKINIAPTYGASLIGCFLAFALWGMLTMQTFLYSLKYPKDPAKFKALVCFLWAMDTGHQIVLAKGMWRGLITNFGNPAELVSWSPELFVQVLFTLTAYIQGLVSLAAHGFLAHRIWKFSGKKWIFLILLYYSLCILGASALAMVHSVIPYNLTLGFNLQLWQRYTNSINAIACGLDIAIATIMCWLLWKGRSGLKRSDRMLGRMAFIIINTGLSTAVTAILVIVTTIIAL
ncbi:hypothetical protein M422DRAFT_49107 [Sphaerobolus stellatus SS14]|uniref:DUF6534 domain-containing protein n=1 Tax=Sphaerobolus stellatus (strain SS14) TaxID=990650 RepID=A0A0C9V0E2_SPHS4|nr:hypothetical protein M422DRAFT_49107 [Sphaerobolus stellatus SS14]